MALGPGSRLGPYEIVALIGSGGMGEVYRAKDPRLGREIAIKILPASLSANEDRLQRFEKEARSASALSHPNILTIYEISSSDSTAYIAMEYVDGKTLREVLQSGPLPARKAVQIAFQLAEGLAKAHEAGIIHRDLKPENIMVSKDGYIKILDFGLAKLFVPQDEKASALPTNVQTDAGTILGTVGYMSPEQASGKEVDFRSDQFAIGSILYEMLTGKRAFQRKTSVQTLAAIIQDDPESITTSGPQVPAPIRWVVGRCLEKDPADRYESTRDLARDLQNIRDHFSEVAGSSETAVIAPPPALSARRLHRIFDVAAVVLILALGALAYFLSHAGKAETKPLSYHRLTYRRGPIQSGRFTPDGETIVYSASFDGPNRELYVTRPEGTEARTLGIQDADILSISPQGQMLILFIRGSQRTLAQAPLSGGLPRELAEDVSGADWAPDGTTMAIAKTQQGKSVLEMPPGNVLYQSSRMLEWVRIAPAGDAIAFCEHISGGANGRIVIIDMKGKKLAESDPFYPSGLTWSQDGSEVLFATLPFEAGAGVEIYALNRNGASRLWQRRPTFSTILDLAKKGKILLQEADDRGILMVSTPGHPPRELSWLDEAEITDFTPDGKSVLFWERGQGSESPSGTIYLRGIDGSPAVRLSGGGAICLAPDGKWAVGDVGAKEVIIVPIGAGNTSSFTFPDLETERSLGLLPDGKSLIFQGVDKFKNSRLYLQNIAGGKPKPITASGVYCPFLHMISPDGKYIIAQDSKKKCFLYPIPSGEPVPFPGMEADEEPVQWTDSSSVLVYNPFKIPAQVFRINISSGKREPYREIAPPDPTGFTRFSSLLFSKDENTFAYSYRCNVGTLYLMEGPR